MLFQQILTRHLSHYISRSKMQKEAKIIKLTINFWWGRLLRCRWQSDVGCISILSPTSVANINVVNGEKLFTGKAMQKTEIPVIPMDSARGRLESNHPDITASFELMDTISCHAMNSLWYITIILHYDSLLICVVKRNKKCEKVVFKEINTEYTVDILPREKMSGHSEANPRLAQIDKWLSVPRSVHWLCFSIRSFDFYLCRAFYYNIPCKK